MNKQYQKKREVKYSQERSFKSLEAAYRHEEFKVESFIPAQNQSKVRNSRFP